MIGKPSPGALINRAHPLMRGVALLVPFTEGAGSGFRDLMGKTAVTPTAVAWRNRGGRFDGSTSRLRLTANPKLAGTGSHSITVAFTHRGINPGGGVLFAKGSDGSGFGWGFCIVTSATGQPIATAVTSGSQTSATGSTPLQIGKRYVLHGTFHSPTRALRIYANGQLAASATTAGTALRYANDSAIGCLFSSGYAVTNASNADIELVVLRTHAMSETEIRMEAADPYAAWTEQPRRFYALASNYTLDAQTGEFIFNGQDAGLSVSAPTTHSAPLIPFRRYSAKINGALVTGTYEQIQALIESIAKAEAEKAAQEAIKEAKKPRRAPFLRIMPGKPIEPHIGKKVDNPLVARPLVQEYEAAYQRFLSAMIEQAIARQLADEIDDEETLLLLI